MNYKKTIPLILALTFCLGFIPKNYQANAIGNFLVSVEFIENEKLDTEVYSRLEPLLTKLFVERNNALLSLNSESLKQFYNLKQKVSLWAFENEAKKIKYLNNWCEKQGVAFTDIKSKVKVRSVKKKDKETFTAAVTLSTEFHYAYTADEKQEDNMFRLGTSHYISLKEDGDHFIIIKEWYTDPFADSLDLNNIKSAEIQDYINSRTKPDIKLNDRLQKAMDYAHNFCGAAADDELGFNYNPKYTDFNPAGGDCANFASQILHEGGGFKKNSTWNYSDGSGSVAWVNAQGFKNYMVQSGRASLVAKGNYSKIYKAAYNLRPGDFVAYEKKGRITHISTVTGLDSKGYPLVTCHNTDRLLVPYDLGWSNPNITFHLVHVHY